MWKVVPVKTLNNDELMLPFVLQVPSTLNSVTSILQVMLECFDFSPYTAHFQQRLKCKTTSPQQFTVGPHLSARGRPNAVLACCFQLLTLRSTGPRRETRFWETCRPSCPWWWSVWRSTWRAAMPLQKLRDWPWWPSWTWCSPTRLLRTLSRQPWLCWFNPSAGSSNTQPVKHRCSASSFLERCASVWHGPFLNIPIIIIIVIITTVQNQKCGEFPFISIAAGKACRWGAWLPAELLGFGLRQWTAGSALASSLRVVSSQEQAASHLSHSVLELHICKFCQPDLSRWNQV